MGRGDSKPRLMEFSEMSKYCFTARIVLALALMLSLGGLAQAKNSVQRPTIAEIALGDANLESLVIAADRAGLVPALLDPEAGPFTVFAPTDEAFELLLEETGIDVSTVPVDALTAVLDDHIIPGRLRQPFISMQGSRGNRLTTQGGLTLGFNVSPFQVNGIDVVARVSASNGEVYVIDRVLLEPAPSITDVAIAAGDALSTLVDAVVATGLAETLSAEGPYTVFAPVNSAFDGVDVGSLTVDELRDVLLDHVVDGNYTSSEIFQLAVTRSSLVTKGGLELTFRGNRVNGTRIIKTNISADNGTIHLIRDVLLED
jgi:transforming growth factor-beta-induced protein